jgi:hypothetical protein
MHRCKRDDIFETLELAYNERAVCPRTGVRDVEVVAAGFRGKFAAFLDEIPELRLPSFELAGFVVG